MAAKISTVVLGVDLDCHLCYKKIKKTLSKLQEKERIHSVFYDEKSNTVTISGPFDPKRIIKKICCNACKIINDIQIKDTDKPKLAEPAKDKPKAAAAEPAKDKPKAAAEPAKDKPKAAAEPAKDKPKAAAEPAKDKPKDKPAEPAKDKPKDKSDDKPKDPKPAEAKKEVKFADGVADAKAMQYGMGSFQPVWQPGPICYGRPGYYNGCNCGCASYGSYGYIPESQPVMGYGSPTYESQPLMGYGPSAYQSQPVMGYSRSAYESQPVLVYSEPAYGGTSYQTNQFFSEQGPQEESCSIM